MRVNHLGTSQRKWQRFGAHLRGLRPPLQNAIVRSSARKTFASGSRGMKRRHPASNPENGISFSDFERMNVQDLSKSLHHACPPWAASDEKVRRVVAAKLCVAIWESNVPSDLKTLKEQIEPRVLARMRKSAEKSSSSRAHLEMVLRFGGPLTFWTSLIYRRFRLGEDSPELARTYGCNPGTIRQQLYRLSLIARAVCTDAEDHLPRHHSAGPLKGFKTLRRAAYEGANAISVMLS
jgi:hypothetical protein